MIIAHDLGTSGNKASLHDDDGHLITKCTKGYQIQLAVGGFAEQNPQDWVDAVCAATRELLATAKVGPSAIAGMAISGQMMGAVFLDANHRPVRPAFIWADLRSRSQAQHLCQTVGQGRMYAVTGHRISPSYTLPKIMWVRDHEPNVFALVEKVCVAKDYVTAALTGRLYTDPSDASSMDIYDLKSRTWSAELMEAAGLDIGLLPEIQPSTTIAGGLTAAAAAECGLAPGTAVVIGGGDGPMSTLGSGRIECDDGAFLCLGTSAYISFASNRPVFDPALRTFSYEHIVPGMYTPCATVQTGAASLSWLAGVVGAPIPELLAEAADYGAAADGLYFLPQLLGERSPGWNADAAGVFAGLRGDHQRGALARAVLEGVSFALRACLDAFADCGHSFTSIDVIGGGASSDLWLQVLADTFGIPTRRRTIVEDGNSLGAAVTGLVGLGLGEFALARTLSEVTGEFEPSSELADYRHIAADLYDRLGSWYAGRTRPAAGPA